MSNTWSKSEDKLIWSSLGKRSPKDIAASIGRSPEEVLRRKEELLAGVDSLSLQERRMKLIVDLEDIADEARSRAKRVDDRSFGPAITASVQALKTVLQEIARIEKNSAGEVQELNEIRLRALVDLLQNTVEKSVPEIAKKYDLDEDELYDVFNKNLLEAARIEEEKHGLEIGR